jgi:hypothetical protein
MLYSLPFHPKPSGLSDIQIRRISRPKHLYNRPQATYFPLVFVSVSRGIVLLDNSTRTGELALLCKEEELLL